MTRYLRLLLFITIAVRIGYFFSEPDFCTDHITQMATANNLAKGHGISLAYAETSNLSLTIYKTHIQWPPLYSLILTGLYFITGNHLISSFLLRIAVCIMLVIFWNKIVKSFIPSISATNRFLLLSLITISTSVFNSLNTILVLPLILFTISFYYSLVFVSNGNKVRYLLFASFFSGLMVWSHYSLILPAFYLPFTFFLFFVLKRIRQYLLNAITSFSVIFFLILLLFFYNLYFSGTLNYMENPGIWEKGFFLKQLFAIKPLFIDALFKTDYLKPFFIKSGLGTLFVIALQALSLFVFVFVLSVLVKKNASVQTSNSNIHFFLVTSSFVFILLTLTLLSYFSLNFKELPSPGWTHLGETRYWGNAYLLILFLIVFSMGFLKFEKIKRISSAILILFVALNLSVNVIIIKKDYSLRGFNLDNLMKKDQLNDLYSEIKSLKTEGKNVIFADTELSVRSARVASLAGASIIDPSFLNVNINLRNNILIFGLFKNENVLGKEKNLRLLLKSDSYRVIGSIGDDVILYKLTL